MADGMKIIVAALFVSAMLIAGCVDEPAIRYLQETGEIPEETPAVNEPPVPEPAINDAVPRGEDSRNYEPPAQTGYGDATTISIATWNIQNFGESKAGDKNRMQIIARTIAKFDVIAVQELSNVNEKIDNNCSRNHDACPGANCGLVENALLEQFRALGKNYSIAVSPQVKDERYMYIYDTDRIELIGSPVLMDDPEDKGETCASQPESAGIMIRQPFLGKFRAKNGNFTFSLLTAHTSPSINIQELEALDYFYRTAKEADAMEDDLILLGDLNGGCSYLNESDKIKLRDANYIWTVGNNTDTTVSDTNCAYDRIIFTEGTSEDFTGKTGVERYDTAFSLTQGRAKTISDHYPVYAEFYVSKE